MLALTPLKPYSQAHPEADLHSLCSVLGGRHSTSPQNCSHTPTFSDPSETVVAYANPYVTALSLENDDHFCQSHACLRSIFLQKALLGPLGLSHRCSPNRAIDVRMDP